MKFISRLILIAGLCILLLSCSQDKNEKTEQGTTKIDAMTSKTADDITKRLKDPVEKARATQELGEEQVKKIENSIK